jgi:hypothetical protein
MTTKNKTSTYDFIVETLAEEDFDAKVMEASEEFPFTQVAFSLGSDDEEREYLLSMFSVTEGAEKLAPGFEADQPELWQLFVEMPFEVLPKAEADVIDAVVRLNTVVPLGSFGYKHSQSVIYYSHSFVTEGLKTQPEGLMETVMMMGSAVFNFGPHLAKIASGERKPEDLVKEVFGDMGGDEAS